VLGGQAVRISTETRKLTCQLSVDLLKSNKYIEEVSLINSWAAKSSLGGNAMKYEKATTGDIILSITLPGWGVLIGLIALLKGEFKRAWTMIGIGIALLAIIALVGG
jgi:hypothetical protein